MSFSVSVSCLFLCNFPAYEWIALIRYSGWCYFRFHQQVATYAQIYLAQITRSYSKLNSTCLLIIDIQNPGVVLVIINLITVFFLSADLSNCKLISFPDGVFKVLTSVSEDIRVITLADNEMKALSSKFFSTFTQLRGSAWYTLELFKSSREDRIAICC